MKNQHQLIKVIFLMIVASLCVVVPLTVFNNVITVFVLYHLFICSLLPLIDFILIRKMRFLDYLNYIRFHDKNIKASIAVGIGHGLLFYIGIVGGYAIFKNMFSFSGVIEGLRDWGVSSNNKFIIVTLMVLFNGIAEEIFWRGYIISRLKQLLTRSSTIILSTLFYTSYHLVTILTFFKLSYLSFILIFLIFIVGLIWGWMRIRYDNLIAPAVGHALATLGYMTIYLFI